MTQGRRVRANVGRVYDLAENCVHVNSDEIEEPTEVTPEMVIMSSDEYWEHHGLDLHGEVELCFLSGFTRTLFIEELLPDGWIYAGEMALS